MHALVFLPNGRGVGEHHKGVRTPTWGWRRTLPTGDSLARGCLLYSQRRPNIITPHLLHTLFNNWANGLGNQFKNLFLAGVAALCWAMWTNRNDMVFDNAPIKTYMEVPFRGTYWLRLWAQLQRHEEHAKEITEAYKALESTVM
jgi:hypothetical protein